MMNDEKPHRGILSVVSDWGSVDSMKIRGWLLVFCALLLIWQPVSLALTMSGLVDQLSIRGAGLGIILLARLLAAALGIAAGLALFQLKPSAVPLAKASLIFSALVDIVVYATPYSPNNRPPGDATIILIASLLYYGIWFAYLARSTRVQTTYS